MPVRHRLLNIVLLLVLPTLAWGAEKALPEDTKLPQLRVIELKEPDGQILSYRHLAGSTEVKMRGTRLAPEAKIHLKVGSRPGFVELDINRGAISGLQPAHRLGKDYLTYVFWAVSVDGRASNLGEITFDGDHPVSINVTTPYQTFWLMVTAEPNFAVAEPSSRVVLYSTGETGNETSDKKALTVRGPLFYYTHYTGYDSASGMPLGSVPNQLLQARKALELASRVSTTGSHARNHGLKEEDYLRESLAQANAFLVRAEEAYKKDPKGRDVVQFARTAAQSAEDARSLATGVSGDLLVRQLQAEVNGLKSGVKDPATKPGPVATPSPTSSRPADPEAQPAQPSKLAALASQPALWFALLGWGLAVVLLFRRKSH
jgi:hypothetical protein